MKKVKAQSGVTLMSAVVAVVAMLILSGTTISMLSKKDSVIAKTAEAVMINEYGEVNEAMHLKQQEYIIDKYTANNTKDLLTYLRNQNIINEENIIDTEALLRKTLISENETGRYEIEKTKETEGEKNYTITYNSANGNKIEVGKIIDDL